MSLFYNISKIEVPLRDSKANQLLDCIFKIKSESNFFIELDKMIKLGENNSVIGSIVTCSKIKC